MTVGTNLTSLYDLDYERWLSRTIELLKEERWSELDREHLIEELEELGRRDKKSAERLLEQVIRHLLFLQYWKKEYNYNSNHWKAEIASFRTQLNEDLTSNLLNHLVENEASVYQKALNYVIQKTGGGISFPAECPYSIQQLLDRNWLPDGGE